MDSRNSSLSITITNDSSAKLANNHSHDQNQNQNQTQIQNESQNESILISNRIAMLSLSMIVTQLTSIKVLITHATI